MKELKTICFQTRGGVNHDYGGLDRVTELLADFFLASGYHVCYLSQVKRHGTHATRQIYLPNQIELISPENIAFYNTFLKEKKVDVLINQEGNVNIIIPLDKQLNKDLIYITVLHFNPNYITDFHFNHKVNKMNIPGFLKVGLNSIINIPFIKYQLLSYLQRKLESNYAINCSNCDRFVLLSNNFKSDFGKLFKIKKLPTNIGAINNPILLNDKVIDISKKKKKLLYVGRLEIGMKQLDKLLNNWNIIAADFPDWTLHLVGGGPDEQLLKDQIKKNNIPRVFFEGIQNPQPYYEETSIFCFSSSSSEGWGMVLVEAQMNGCVPVAFQSYSAITDIILDNENGILVPAYGNALYISALKNLMINNELRNKLANNAIINAKRFDVSQIGKQWIQLFEEVKLEKKNKI
jgi:glycosyltransferase involved in cell wall biosynthesis